MHNTPDQTYCFGEFTLNLTRGCLLRGDEERELQPKPFEVLTYMVRNPYKLITKNELIDAVWGENHAGAEGSLVHCVTSVRRALGDEEQKKIVETRHKLGYRFNPDAANPSTAHASVIQEPGKELNRATQTAAGDFSIAELSVQQTDKRPTLGEDLTGETQAALHDISEPRLSVEETNRETTSVRHGAKDVSKYSRDETETFESWMGGRGWAVTLTLVVCVMVTIVISISVYVRWQTDAAIAAKIAASGTQCLVILIAYVSSWHWNRAKGFGPIEQYTEPEIKEAGFTDFQDFRNDKSSLEIALRQYTKYWRWLLLSWVPLYLLFALENLIGQPVSAVDDRMDQTITVLEIVFNIVNTAMIFLCFNVLNLDDEDDEHLPLSALIRLVFILLVSVLVITIITGKLDGATLLTGIAAGVIMALYVGRLQSKFLGPRPWLLILLYSYTAIQPLVLYIKDQPIWAVIILDFALILKCLLFLYMTWLFQSGLLLFYFARMKRTYGPERNQRKAFRKLLK